jgi:tRNA uridine 5-carboxymethylaminomethyl modification enzyme
MVNKYDIIVVGAGHAGCEAAAAAANLGSKVLLITMDMTKFAQMSCNPAMGGIAKGQILREIDAMGGYSGIVTDRSMIQFRMLNLSKGPAMWSPRAQCDRTKFTVEWRNVLESLKGLDFWQDSVVRLIVENGCVVGVTTQLGITFYSNAVILTNGTFLNGLIHIGKNQVKGGRISEPASFGISDQLRELGFEVSRMKTGTPARLDGRSIDFSVLTEQKGDEGKGCFSYVHTGNYLLPQRSCFITYTNKKTHDILRTGFGESPLFTGIIKGRGPRYCPSIEDKIVTFADKTRHQLFLEPEGVSTVEYYVNGFSSSLPWNIQYEALRTIKGLEKVKIFRSGYAIEYDYCPPTQLKSTLETKNINNLFFAGQINGTTGYEEAAAQGLMAGINAALKLKGAAGLVFKRDQAYIGVLIDDLVTKGVDEPYRMFTSRAEYRILLRQDNADSRLTELSWKIGLASQERFKIYQDKYAKRNELIKFVSNYSVRPEDANPILVLKETAEIKQAVKLRDLIMRPQISLNDFIKVIPELVNILDHEERKQEILESAEILIKYTGYIEREKDLAEKINRLEYIKIHDGINYSILQSLSTEARQKLNRIRPSTIGQAARIPGVSPSDINVLLIYHDR